MEVETSTDFDPTTEEGQEDINETIDDEYESLITENPEGVFLRLRNTFGDRARSAWAAFRDKWRSRNPGVSEPEYLQMETFDTLEHDEMRMNSVDMQNREKSQDEVWDEITSRFPESDPTVFTARKNEYDQVVVRLQRRNATEYNLLEGDKLNPKLPKTIKNALGPRTTETQEIATVVSSENAEILLNAEQQIQDNQSVTEDPAQTQEIRDRAREKVTAEEQHLTNLQQDFLDREARILEEQLREDLNPFEREDVERRLKRINRLILKNKIKNALMKVGLPLLIASGIATAVGVIINMLNAAGGGIKQVGQGLANLGKKIAASIPGLLGSVLSLVLKTGGELLKFVGNNIWILVVAIGMVFMKEVRRRR